MAEGVAILCKDSLVMSHYTVLKPYAEINSSEKVQLAWGREVFIPLVPNMPYQISVQWPYIAKKDCNKAILNVTVKEGEIQHYKYKTSSLSVWNKGKIERI